MNLTNLTVLLMSVEVAGNVAKLGVLERQAVKTVEIEGWMSQLRRSIESDRARIVELENAK